MKLKKLKLKETQIMSNDEMRRIFGGKTIYHCYRRKDPLSPIYQFDTESKEVSDSWVNTWTGLGWLVTVTEEYQPDGPGNGYYYST